MVVDAQQRNFLTEMRGGTNLLRVELGRWKGEQLEERTCSFCAMGLVEDEPHALLECSAYYIGSGANSFLRFYSLPDMTCRGWQWIRTGCSRCYWE